MSTAIGFGHIALCGGLTVAIIAGTGRAQQLIRQHVGTFEGGGFGWSVTGIADLDGDGADEYAVAAPFDDYWGAGAGRVTVYDGKTGAVIRTLIGSLSSSYGVSIADAGDVDDDGFHDLVIGIPGADSPWLESGAFSIVNGRTGDTFVTIYGSPGDWLGWSVAGAGDVDSDGLDDVIVSAPGWSSFTGKAAVYNRYGAVLWSVAGTQAGAWFGFSVAAAGTIRTKERISDLIVGEPFFAEARGSLPEVGRAHVLSGADGAEIFTLTGTLVNGCFGYSVSGGADLDADGWDDVIVGAPGDSTIAVSSGVARGYGGKDGAEIFAVYGDDADDRMGATVLAIRGDVTGDGIADFAVGAPSGGDDGEAGLVRLFAGGWIPLKVHDFEPPPGDCSENGSFGESIGSGNFTGSGPLDLIIGMPEDCEINTAAAPGSAWIYATWFAYHFDYGIGWPGGLGVPSLEALDDPVIGRRMSIQLENSAGAKTLALLLVGFQQIDVTTSAGGHLLVAPRLIMPLALGRDGITLDGVLPYDDALAGLEVDLQALEVDPAASCGLSFTAGLELVLGYARS